MKPAQQLRLPPENELRSSSRSPPSTSTSATVRPWWSGQSRWTACELHKLLRSACFCTQPVRRPAFFPTPRQSKPIALKLIVPHNGPETGYFHSPHRGGAQAPSTFQF